MSDKKLEADYARTAQVVDILVRHLNAGVQRQMRASGNLRPIRALDETSPEIVSVAVCIVQAMKFGDLKTMQAARGDLEDFAQKMDSSEYLTALVNTAALGNSPIEVYERFDFAAQARRLLGKGTDADKTPDKTLGRSLAEGFNQLGFTVSHGETAAYANTLGDLLDIWKLGHRKGAVLQHIKREKAKGVFF